MNTRGRPTRLTCPRCMIRPKAISASGNTRDYCGICRSELTADYRLRHKGEKLNADKPCAMCKAKPRRVRSTGTMSCYCPECDKMLSSRWNSMRVQRWLDGMATGEPTTPVVTQRRTVHTRTPAPARVWSIRPPRLNAYGQPVPDFGAGVSVSFLSPEQVAEAKANRNQNFESGVYRG
jgi:hypothetical protein